MTCNYQGHGFIQHFPVWHGLAGFLVPRCHQHAEKVVSLDTFCPTSRDQFANESHEAAEPIGELQITGGVFGDEGEGILSHPFSEPFQILAKNAAQDNGKSQFAHLRGDGYGFSATGCVFPNGHSIRDFGFDRIGEGFDDTTMEKRLDHPALTSPEVSLTGHDPVTEQDADTIEANSLRVIAVVRYQNTLDIGRVIQNPRVAITAGGMDAKKVT